MVLVGESDRRGGSWRVRSAELPNQWILTSALYANGAIKSEHKATNTGLSSFHEEFLSGHVMVAAPVSADELSLMGAPVCQTTSLGS